MKENLKFRHFHMAVCVLPLGSSIVTVTVVTVAAATVTVMKYLSH